MLRFFLTHHFGTEQVSGNSTTVGEVNTSEGLYLNSRAAVHIKANLDMTLLSLQWDSCCKWYKVRRSGDKGQWGGRTLFQYHFKIKINMISYQSFVNTLQNGTLRSRGLQKDRKFQAQSLKDVSEWFSMRELFHESVEPLYFTHTLAFHLRPSLLWFPKSLCFGRLNVLPPI